MSKKVKQKFLKAEELSTGDKLEHGEIIAISRTNGSSYFLVEGEKEKLTIFSMGNKCRTYPVLPYFIPKNVLLELIENSMIADTELEAEIKVPKEPKKEKTKSVEEPKEKKTISDVKKEAEDLAQSVIKNIKKKKTPKVKATPNETTDDSVKKIVKPAKKKK